MDSKLEEQRSVIKFLLLEGEKTCHIFISRSYFIGGFHSSERGFYTNILG